VISSTPAPEPDRSRWILRTAPRLDARITVYCLPYAGGGASGYREWPHILPLWAEVAAVQLPGRENRIVEPPRVDVAEIAAVIAADLDERATAEYALFGHSMGGLLAFEAARLLTDGGRHVPTYVGISAASYPPSYRRPTAVSELPDSELLAWAAGLGGASGSALANPQLQELILPALRADCAWLEEYVLHPGPPLTCPLSVFAGEQDEEAPLEWLEGWKSETTGQFRLRRYPGGHFYLVSRLSAVLGDLTMDLSARLTAKDSLAG
jgi:surfactin synthase thioesterase subunit